MNVRENEYGNIKVEKILEKLNTKKEFNKNGCVICQMLRSDFTSREKTSPIIPMGDQCKEKY